MEQKIIDKIISKSNELINVKNVLSLTVLWGSIILAIAIYFDVFDDEYFRVGPKPNLKVFSIVIDTWGKYIMAILFYAFQQVMMATTRNISLIYITLQALIKTAKPEYKYWQYVIIYFITGRFDFLNWLMHFKTSISSVDFMLVEETVDVIITLIVLYVIDREKRREIFPIENDQINQDEPKPLLNSVSIDISS